MTWEFWTLYVVGMLPAGFMVKWVADTNTSGEAMHWWVRACSIVMWPAASMIVVLVGARVIGASLWDAAKSATRG